MLLALNAAEGLIQILLARTDSVASAAGPLFFRAFSAPSQGAEALAPALAEAFAACGAAPNDIERIVCVAGPGSFTGIRLVIAAAAGLARAGTAAQGGMPYMPLLAASVAEYLKSGGNGENTAAGLIWAVTHARRNLVHAQAFAVQPHPVPDAARSVRPVTDILVLSLESALQAIVEQDRPVFLCGSGLRRNFDFFSSAALPQGSVLLPEDCDHPAQSVLLHSALSTACARSDIVPLYARPCDAEENLSAIAASLGLDPEAAKTRLLELTGGSVPVPSARR